MPFWEQNSRIPSTRSDLFLPQSTFPLGKQVEYYCSLKFYRTRKFFDLSASTTRLNDINEHLVVLHGDFWMGECCIYPGYSLATGSLWCTGDENPFIAPTAETVVNLRNPFMILVWSDSDFLWFNGSGSQTAPSSMLLWLWWKDLAIKSWKPSAI